MCCKLNMRYIYVTLRKRNNIKQRLFLETQKLKVATSTWSMLEPRMLNVNHLQYTWNIQYHTFDCIGTPRKKNPSLLWDYCEFANDVRSCNRCAWSFSNLAYAEMDMLISCLIAACLYNLHFSCTAKNCKQKSSYCHWTHEILFVGECTFILIIPFGLGPHNSTQLIRVLP